MSFPDLNFPSSNECGGFDHLSRRALLRGLGLSSLGWLTPLSQTLARSAEAPSRHRPKTLIVVWLQGGASQLETFDPHPGSSIAYGSSAIGTAIPGVKFGAGLEQTASIAGDLAVVRSMVGKEGDHRRAVYNLKSGHRPLPGLVHPSLGSIVCHELPDAPTDLPTHISIRSGASAAKGGYLGAHYDAFKIFDPKDSIPDVGARVGDPRQQRRLEGLAVLEQNFSAGRLPDLDGQRTLHRNATKRALTMMSSDQLKAFDVSEEAADVRAAFGDNPFGRSCLASVRLAEAGVRCIEVTLGGWDTHIDNHSNVSELLTTLDPAFAALITTLKARDLFEDTIVLLGTEFGRTPKLNVADGRDHWPHGFSVLLGGGGIRPGMVLGETDPSGESRDPGKPVRVQDLHATILDAFGIDYRHEIMTPLSRPISLSEGRSVKSLLV
ncbi:MAG: DUF1501 domain-containing protein [Verrucomicrobiota bacterium]